jgi:hypothetical protein
MRNIHNKFMVYIESDMQLIFMVNLFNEDTSF